MILSDNINKSSNGRCNRLAPPIFFMPLEYMPLSHRNLDFVVSALVVSVGNTAAIEDTLRCDDRIAVRVEVSEIHDLRDTALRDNLRALVAREQVYVERSTLHALRAPAEVEDRVQLAVAHEEVLLAQLAVSVASPRELPVVHPVRRAVVADGQDTVIAIDDACPDLRIRVFRAHGE